MKWFYLVELLLLLGILSCKGEQNNLQDITKHNEDPVEEFFDSLKDVLLEKCKAQGVEESIQKVGDTVNSVDKCLRTNLSKNPISFHQTIIDNSEAICSNKRKDVRGCFEDIVQLFESCSADNQKFTPKFFLDAVDALLDYICSDDGAVALSLINDDTISCLSDIVDQGNSTDVCRYQLVINTEAKKPEELTVTKEELCSDLRTLKTCYGDYIQQQCPKDKGLKNALVGVINAVSSLC